MKTSKQEREVLETKVRSQQLNKFYHHHQGHHYTGYQSLDCTIGLIYSNLDNKNNHHQNQLNEQIEWSHEQITKANVKKTTPHHNDLNTLGAKSFD